ncbi:hypothetical protein BJV82DRAFT_585853 [Fennellomyces sp. T-0311]|nr:hypothetical protein BJV82DRAFT_585853 [Fennellomyces sp. T-0311]
MATTTTTMAAAGYRKSVYDDFADDVPETPSENVSTFSALSPIVDAVRYAKKEGARDWQRLFGSFQKWTTGSTAQQVEDHKIIKHNSEKVVPMKRRSSSSDDESTSLTPVLERHSLRHNFPPSVYPMSVPRSPLRYRESIFGSATQSMDSREPTPSLDGSVYHSDRTSNFGGDEELVSKAYRSPVRPKQPARLHLVSPIELKSSELERLDRLQRRLDEIRNITKRLAQPGNMSTVTRHSQRMEATPRVSPLLKSHHNNLESIIAQDNCSAQPSPVRSQSSPTPPQSIASASQPRDEPPPPPPPPPPPASYIATRTPPRRGSAHPSKTPAGRSAPRTPSSAMRNVLSDIPKAKLRSTETFQTPNGSKVSNKFWEEIQAAKQSNESSTRSTRLRNAASPSVNKGKSPARIPSQWEEGDFWTSSSPNTGNSFTDKLRRIAREEEEERDRQRFTYACTPGSLGEELETANRKTQQEALERERAKVQASSFALEPTDSSSGSGSGKARRIDGDEWMFSGKHYTVKEKR